MYITEFFKIELCRISTLFEDSKTMVQTVAEVLEKYSLWGPHFWTLGDLICFFSPGNPIKKIVNSVSWGDQKTMRFLLLTEL